MNIHPSKLPLSDLWNVRLDGAECLFDPELHDGPDPLMAIEHSEARAAREDVARDICGMCLVRDACLSYALSVRPERGVWAGRTADEVARLADTTRYLGEVA
jgi:hypothetical protein